MAWKINVSQKRTKEHPSEPRPIFHHKLSGCDFCSIALVILPTMVVNPSQIVWA